MLILIHGYGGSPAEMEPLRRHLAARTEVKAPTMLAHGGRPIPPSRGFEPLMEDLIEQLGWAGGEPEPAFVLGYSLGGYLALALARRFPGRVRGVVAIATQFRFDAAALSHIRSLLTPQRIFGTDEQRRGALEQRFGAPITAERFARAAVLFQQLHDEPPLSDEDLKGISAPALIISGEQDPLASGAETRALARLLPNARLATFPGRAHPIDTLPIELVAREALRFIADVESGTFVPGPPVDLGGSLVTGGIANASVQVTVRPAKD